MNEEKQRVITITRDAGANLKLLKNLERQGFIRIFDVMLEGGRENKKVMQERKLLPAFVWDHSRWGEGIIADDDNKYDEIRKVIGRNNVKDAMHLEAHLRSGHDYFITEDRDDILKYKDVLKEKFNIEVLSPAELEAFCHMHFSDMRARHELAIVGIMSKTVLCRDIEGNQHQVSVSDLTFRPSVYGVIINDGKILMTRYKDGYDFPGGGIDIGEPIIDALKREVLEETGVEVDVAEPLFVQDDFFTHPITKKSHHTILLFYRCVNPRGEINMDHFHESDHELGTLKAAWVPTEEALTKKFYNPIDSPALIRKAAGI